MAFDHEFRELMEEAREAVRRLLIASEPDSWGALRVGYGQLRDNLARDDRDREKVAAEKQTEHTWPWKGRDGQRITEAEHRELARTWDRVPRQRRESLIFQVLGDEQLTVRELTERLDPLLAPGWIYQSSVASMVRRMFQQGHLDRIVESYRNKPRYRYFRKAGLDGPIADLERAYHDNGETVA